MTEALDDWEIDFWKPIDAQFRVAKHAKHAQNKDQNGSEDGAVYADFGEFMH